jgi:hypothetical protein
MNYQCDPVTRLATLTTRDVTASLELPYFAGLQLNFFSTGLNQTMLHI